MRPRTKTARERSLLSRLQSIKKGCGASELNLRAVLHHLLHRDQSFLAERRQDLREQFIHLLFFHREIRQGVLVYLIN